MLLDGLDLFSAHDTQVQAGGWS